MFQQLDDNQVTLSTMKASRFVKAFEEEVDHWERTLSLILEVVEMILQVQRQWMYLEVRGEKKKGRERERGGNEELSVHTQYNIIQYSDCL